MAVMSMGRDSGLTCNCMDWPGNGDQNRSVGFAAGAEGAEDAEAVLLEGDEVGITISVTEWRRWWVCGWGLFRDGAKN